MKNKRTLRTKITLTIAGLLGLTGIFYGAQFSSVTGPVGVAAAPDLLLVTPYCLDEVDTMDCAGKVSMLTDIPGNGDCAEKYLAIAPTESANAGFTPRDVFVTHGSNIYQIRGNTVLNGRAPFATISGCGDDHAGITFDHVGNFGWNMIVTCQAGTVWKVDGNGVPASIANIADTLGFVEIEGPAIPPASFGFYGGQILVADEYSGYVHAIDSNGFLSSYIFPWGSAESVIVLPSALDRCNFCNDNAGSGAFFQAVESLGAIHQFPLSDFSDYGGGILITSEFGGGISVVTSTGPNATDYNQGFFGGVPADTLEGAAFADCHVPLASPSPTQPPPPPAETDLAVDAATGTYGGTTTVHATLTSRSNHLPIANKTITFTLNGNAVGTGTTNASGMAKSSAVPLVGSAYSAGSYPTGAYASFAGDSSFGHSSGTNSLTVNKATLIVTADDKTRPYGAPNPDFSVSYNGFVTGEGDPHGPFASSGVTGATYLTTTATQFSPVGQYPITFTQATTLNGGTNYDIHYVPGTLTVYLCGGIIGLNKITIGASTAIVDSYISPNYPSLPSDQALLLSNGTITLQGAKVYGDMDTIGNVVLQANSLVTGDVTYGTTINVAGSAAVQGSRTSQASSPLVLSIPGACGSYTQNPATWISGAYTYDAAKGNLTVSGGGTATLANGTYCFNNVTVSGGSTLRINGPVKINVTGKFTDSGGSLQNTSYNPANLQVASSYTGSNGVTVSGTSATYIMIYAPGTDLTVSGGGPLYGSLVAKTLTVSGNSQIHQDLGLPCWQ